MGAYVVEVREGQLVRPEVPHDRRFREALEFLGLAIDQFGQRR